MSAMSPNDGGGLTTEQIAAATPHDQAPHAETRAPAVPQPEAKMPTPVAPQPEAAAAPSEAPTDEAPNDEALDRDGREPSLLLETDELQSVILRWREIQAAFVDEPRQAVQDADALVADLMQRLAKMFARERGELESRWSSGAEVSTEDLRLGLRRYRSFFERLLAA